MPIVFRKDIYESAGELILWHSTESIEDLEAAAVLNDTEKQLLERLCSDKRRREWLTARVMLRQALGCGLSYEPSGRPVATNGKKHISISHARDYVALLYGDSVCGVDIESRDRDFCRVASKFVSPEEHSLTDDLSLIWCAKEAVFKMTGEVNLLKIAIDSIDKSKKEIYSSNIILTYIINIPNNYTVVYGFAGSH